MPKHTQTSRRRFRTIRDEIFNAQVAISAQENIACAEGREAEAKKLYKIRHQLGDELVQVVDAYVTFLTSKQKMEVLIATLEGEIGKIKGSLNAMQKAKEILSNAAKILKVVTGLVKLVT